MKNNNKLKGVIFLVSSAFFFGIMSIFIRLLGSGGLPPMSQLFLRYIFAFICAFVYIFVIKKAKIKIVKKDIVLILITTIFGYALTNLVITYSVLLTQISNFLFLFYSYAIIAPILGFIFLKDRINKANIFSLVLSFIALFLLFQPNSVSTWKLGGFLSILSALGQAGYLILRKKLQQYPANVMMFINTLTGVLVLSILSLVFENSFYMKGGITHMSVKTWFTTILSGIDNFLAWFTMTKGFEYFKATSGSLILLSELLFGIFFAFIFFKEVPTFMALVGGVLILISTTLVILKGEN